MVAVKSSKRQLRAAETRRRMLAAAYELFVENGYGATSMPAIAERAGVAVQTLHFTFHTKARLLTEVVEVYAAGAEGAPPVMERKWAREAVTTRDPHRALALVIEHGTDIYGRVAPLEPAAIAAAGVDREFAAVWHAIADGRHRGMRRFIEAIEALGALKPGLTVDRATDIFTTVHSHEVFLSLTVRCGWTLAELKAWEYDMLCRELLGKAPAGARRRGAAGLSYADRLTAM
jgi:AcrR family transcriptional regulator